MNKEYWEKNAESYNKVSTSLDTHLDKYSFIASKISSINPKIILDIGCGGGILLKELFRIGYEGEAIGVDFSDRMLRIAQQNNIGNKVRFLKHDINDRLPFEAGQFDCCVAVNVLFNTSSNYISNLTEIDRVLSNGGYVFIVEPTNQEAIGSLTKDNIGNINLKNSIKHLKNLPHYLKLSIAQLQLDKMVRKGQEKYLSTDKLSEYFSALKYDLFETVLLQANTNIFFMARKKS